MRTRLAWAAGALLLIPALLHPINPLPLWAPEGLARFAAFTAVFALLTLAIRLTRPTLYLPTTLLAAAIFALTQSIPVTALITPVLFLGAVYLTGRALAPAESPILAVPLGLAAWIFLLSLAVHLPINTPLTHGLAVALPWLLFRRHIPRQLPAILPTLPNALVLFLLAAHFVIACKPETSADGLAMHLAAPAVIAHEKLWAFDPARFAWSLMPMGADWLFTTNYLLGGEYAARLFNFALAAVLAVQIRHTAQSPLAAALFLSTPLVQLVTGSLFVENTWAVLLFGAVTAGPAYAAPLLGAALSVKIGSTAFLPLLLWKRPPLRAALLAVALAAPTYLTAYAKTGNPAYPYLNHIFKSPSFPSDQPFQENRYREPLRWTTPFDLTFHSDRYFEGQSPAPGLQYFLLLLPAGLLLTRNRRLTALALAAGLLTYLTQPNIRYLYPSLALLAVPLAQSPHPALLVAATAVNLAYLPAAGYYHREFLLPSASARGTYLEIGAPQRQLIDWLNTNAPNKPVAFFGGNPVAGLKATAYTDQWHNWPYSDDLNHFATAADYHSKCRQLGIEYLIAPADGKTRYPAANRLLKGVPALATSGRYALFRLPENPAPNR